ncbi:30S ribosomal protein S18 [Candidatus Peregrinibacteria bacterium RIFOXYC2_FULL_33_13]|nr:MAG: 30S ribosomal protein S18 [Candidatus Peregrinibacteria bacterium GW2011_GWA2_33_10]KKP38485.1 MAG: 30S ribosomal protein S18P, small subunit ribosomal protein S18 [Candidatus Peregrinibacteria bacterium GW2011_GWC2_33_13]OGJ50025.1 MAG: 30S ribosomal protein S18 [Candidatus Peregrinibacteria bacterium RIFOXYA2_FULL_33_7]OGJ55020.1 MAG: 30S ribosomal protein S18 [Candidatus Peregrinibacteria bacterium RIFOXYC2_FULL_33_13]
MNHQQPQPVKKKKCQFCESDSPYIDYKNLNQIAKYTTELKRIKPRYYTGVCLNHQKSLGKAIKVARIMGLLPFVPRVR